MGLLILAISILLGWAVLVLPWVFLWRRWRRDGFDWWMIPVGLFAMFATGYLVYYLVYIVSCMVKGGCETL